MRKFFLNLLLLAGIYCAYKVGVFTVSVLMAHSQYSFNPYPDEANFGSDTKANQLIILGSSNTRYDFDYTALNTTFKNRSVHSVSTSTPYGLYYTLNKFINSKWNKKENVVVIDLPYTLFARESFLPFTGAAYKLVDFNDAKKLLVKAPRGFFNYVFDESVLNPEFVDSLISISKNYKKKITFHTDLSKSLAVQNAQDFDNGYANCSTPYDKDRQFLKDVRIDESHLLFIKSYIAQNIKGQVYYLFPEINKNNNTISAKTVNLIRKHLNPLNSFQSSEYPNNQLYDQWYHLNKCGAVINTQNLVKNLKDVDLN